MNIHEAPDQASPAQSFKELLEAPVQQAVARVSDSDATLPARALGIRTSEDLANNRVLQAGAGRDAYVLAQLVGEGGPGDRSGHGPRATRGRGTCRRARWRTDDR